MMRVPKVVIDPDQDSELEADEPTEIEMEQAAAGDITLLGDPTFNDYHWSIWRQRSRAEIAGDPRAPAWEFITKAVGPIDATSMIAELGGGVFEFRGYVDVGDGRGKRMKRHPVIALAGPRKNFAIDPAATVTPATPTAGINGLTRAERIMLRMIRGQEQRLQNVERAPAAPGMSLKDMVESLVMLDSVRQKGAAPSDTATAKELFTTMMAATKTGIELGQSREPIAAEEENATVKVIEAVAPLATRFLDILGSARKPRPGPAAPSGSPTATPPPSTAEVVDQPVLNAEAARWIAAIDRLESLMPAADEAAEEIAVILTESDLKDVLPFPNDSVIAQILARVPSGSVLATPDGRAYLALVLDELRKPDQGD